MIFLTGGTGYLGSYVIAELLAAEPARRLFVLTRAKDRADAIHKLWRAMQLHWDLERFAQALPSIEFIAGDLNEPDLGISPRDRARLIEQTESVLHVAASLNRKSNKACFNANLRGTLSVLKLAREMNDRRPLRRFSFVSTSAVMGQREHECVKEDDSIDWDRSDYDPYARTKKFCEHMVRELLPDVPVTIFRPSTVLGDSRFSETTQFEMVKAYCFFADLPVVPIGKDVRQDIVNADYVGKAIATIHTKEKPAYDCYHLSGGAKSKTAHEIGVALLAGSGRRVPVFAGKAQAPFAAIVGRFANGPRGRLSLMASLLHVFLPYVTNDVVFDNTRVVEELGFAPAPFTDYCAELYRWAKAAKFEYPYAPLPAAVLRGAGDPEQSSPSAPPAKREGMAV